jgi:molybdopterin synthase catalytic subunit
MKPSIDQWLAEAKAAPEAENCGMYLTHCGTVRRSAKAKVRLGETNTRDVTGMRFSYDAEKVARAVDATRAMDGIFIVRVWLNEGVLNLGDDIMLVLIGGDIRPHVVDALQFLVGSIKSECVVEEEIYE